MGRSVTSKSEIGLKRKWPQKKKGVKTVVVFVQSLIRTSTILVGVIGHFRRIPSYFIFHVY